MQLGFVIDHARCIGCHACTVACKAENDVPLARFRTWVKYTEQGVHPEVRRSFAVLRCNQCSNAPCVEICPVRALEKRPDGIVDVDPAACIGCKACLQACPYDALYIHPRHGTAEKCHFCAHRLESGLAPACAVVCPTEAIIPGDFDDPASAVSRLRRDDRLTARKPEAGTGPNVLYREAAPAGLDPLAAAVAGGYLWADRAPAADVLRAERFDAARAEAERRARTTYDVDHAPPWGRKVSAYVFTKSLAAGLYLAQVPFFLTAQAGSAPAPWARWAALASLAFLALTAALLVADLRRPERFLYILTRPNPRSWLTRGTWVLIGFGAAAAAWAGLLFAAPGAAAGAAGKALLLAGAVPAALAAAYTGWLFGQARGRVLWMRRALAAQLVVQALVAGAGALLVAAPGTAGGGRLLALALALHGAFLLAEPWLAPASREREFHRASRLVTRGPFAARHWGVGLAAGVAVPLLLLGSTSSPGAAAAAGALALAGLLVEDDVLVRAGQALPIS